MVNDGDVRRVCEACRCLPEPEGDYLVDDFLTNLVATVVDFQTHTTTVERALEHFTEEVRPTLAGLDDLIALMGRFPDDQDGNTALALHLWNYRMWTRAGMLRNLVAYFVSVGVTDRTTLRRWADSADFDRDFKGRVRGLGRAVFQWLVMRQGIDTIKPDVHVHRFLATVLGRPVSDTEAIDLIVAAARRLGCPAHRLDWSIWEAGRRGTPPPSDAGTGRPPSGHGRPDPPGPESRAATDHSIVSFVDDDTGYLAWIAAHPKGYVLNCERTPTPRYLVLHRADCHTVAPRNAADARIWTTAYRKVTSLTAEDLISWAERETAASPAPCRICRPSPAGTR